MGDRWEQETENTIKYMVTIDEYLNKFIVEYYKSLDKFINLF